MTVPNFASGPPPGALPTPGPTPASPTPSTAGSTGRGPKITIWIGAVLTALGTIAFVAGFVVMGAELFDTVEEGMDPVSELDLTVPVPGEGTVDLEADRYQLVALGPTLTASELPSTPPMNGQDCSAACSALPYGCNST